MSQPKLCSSPDLLQALLSQHFSQVSNALFYRFHYPVYTFEYMVMTLTSDMRIINLANAIPIKERRFLSRFIMLKDRYWRE
jgi:hypothetical protein